VSSRAPDLYLVAALREIGHVVDLLANPSDGPVRLSSGAYDAALLDVAQPDLELLKAFAPDVGHAVLVVVADQLGGLAPLALRAGADACLQRPIQIQELQERLRALMRVGDRMRLDPAVSEALSIVRSQRALVLDGRRAPLSPLEVQVLTYLMRRAGEVVGPERLHAAVWGDVAEPNPERVRATLGRLRRKLAEALGRSVIETAPGQGYVFRLTL
jgi:DNA-binding response OmpR family regulator